MADEKLLSLNDLVFGFIQLTRERWPNATFPLWYSRLWDQVFYELKISHGLKFPGLNKALEFFEWDAPHPHNPELREVLQSAHVLRKLWINEQDRIYPVQYLKHNLPVPLFEKILEIAQKHSGMLINI